MCVCVCVRGYRLSARCVWGGGGGVWGVDVGAAHRLRCAVGSEKFLFFVSGLGFGI